MSSRPRLGELSVHVVQGLKEWTCSRPFRTSLGLEWGPKEGGPDGAAAGGSPRPPEGCSTSKGTWCGVSGHRSSPATRSLPCSAGADVPMEACCADGHRMATQHRSCSLPYASESKECRYACQGPSGAREVLLSREGERKGQCVPDPPFLLVCCCGRGCTHICLGHCFPFFRGVLFSRCTERV